MPGPVQPAVDLRLLEQMSQGLPDANGFHTPQGVQVVEEMAERAGAVVLGPGPRVATRARRSSPEAWRAAAGAPLLVDADGLNAHAGRLELFRGSRGADAPTPHEGELGRLLGRDSDEVARSPPRLPPARRPSAAAPWCS